MRATTYALPMLLVIAPACTRSVIATDAADSTATPDASEPTLDASLMETLDAIEASDAGLTDVRDASTNFDPRDSGRCDPRRVRALNSGIECWNRFPDAPGLECRAGGFTCQEGVCCSGRINPETCDCECPDVDAGVCDLRGTFPRSLCCLSWGHDLPEPQFGTCTPPNGYACNSTRAELDWQTAQRDR